MSRRPWFVGRATPARRHRRDNIGRCFELASERVEYPRLQTARLDLRPLPPAAAAALSGNRHAATSELGAALSPEWPHADLFDVLPMQAVATSSAVPYGVWVIIERATDMVIGDIGFRGPPDADGTVEIGYSVVPARRRRGYATESARALLRWAAEQPGVDSVVAGCDRANVASIKTLERLGFRRTGETNSELRWRTEPPR